MEIWMVLFLKWGHKAAHLSSEALCVWTDQSMHKVNIYVDRFPLSLSFGLYNEMLQERSLTPVNAITFDPKRVGKRDEILQLSTC
jgi:hypothetical protein